MDVQDAKRISGSPSSRQVVVTSGAPITITSPVVAGGFQVIADAVVTWTSYSGTTNSTVTIPAGITVPGLMTAVSVASGTIIVHFW